MKPDKDSPFVADEIVVAPAVSLLWEYLHLPADAESKRRVELAAALDKARTSGELIKDTEEFIEECFAAEGVT